MKPGVHADAEVDRPKMQRGVPGTTTQPPVEQHVPEEGKSLNEQRRQASASALRLNRARNTKA